MRYPMSWLQEYVEIALAPEVLAERLTQAGLEVEAVHVLGRDLCGVVSGRIVEIAKHPDADRLQITQVFDGQQTHQIVTGAQNVFVGAVVPVSLPGAVLANGLKIKPSKLRGVPSNGMLCSQAELGMVDSAEGIWILDADTPLGLDMVAYAGLRDVIIEIGILPNRGDCLGIYGMAREIAAVLQVPLKPLSVGLPPFVSQPLPAVHVKDSRCSQYIMRRMVLPTSDLKTPLWMQRRLALCGLRSVSLAVDITNYVLLETGQPLHVFDADKLSGDLHVTAAPAGMMIQTLDEQVHELPEKALVISDDTGPVAIAGVMGGLGSAVDAHTRDIVLEAAVFDPVSVRRTGAYLGLRTESAVRFEKGLDWDGVLRASDRAAHLFVRLAGASVTEAHVTLGAQGRPVLRRIPFVPDQINRLLGTSFSEEQMRQVLLSLGIEIAHDGQNSVAIVPSWRAHDLVDWPCLAEEIARMAGYDQIPEAFPDRWVPIASPTPLQQMVAVSESFWISRGYQQVCTFSMVSPEDFQKTNMRLPAEALHIRNPLTQESSVLRRYLMPSLLQVAAHHAKRQVEDLRIFEVGKVFWLSEEGVQENQVSGILVYGPVSHTYRAAQKESYFLDFSYLKGQAEAFLTHVGFRDVYFKPSKYPQYHPYASADIFFSDVLIGNVGYLHPDVTEAYGISQQVGYIGLNLTALSRFDLQTARYVGFSRQPSTRRDVAMLAPRDLPYIEIVSAIDKVLPAAVADYYLFDAYEGDVLGPDKKSLAFAFVYQDPEKTLSDEDVNAQHQAFVAALQGVIPIGLR